MIREKIMSNNKKTFSIDNFPLKTTKKKLSPTGLLGSIKSR